MKPFNKVFVSKPIQVMSDEFNVPNRTFKDGHDPMWTALDKPDEDFSSTGRGSLHFYNSSSVTTTKEGYLKISTTIDKTEWEYYNTTGKNYLHRERYFKSGMIQGWNKFCFTGGIIEVDVKFPGIGHVGGLWPAIWMLGNLGRATYEASTNLLWPWSFDKCDRSLQLAQSISACNEQNHYGLQPRKGRGATEIDIVEVMYGEGGALPNTIPPIEQPYADFTLQVSSFITSFFCDVAYFSMLMCKLKKIAFTHTSSVHQFLSRSSKDCTRSAT